MKKNKKFKKNYYIYLIISLPIFLLLFKNLFFNGRKSDIFLLNNPKDYVVEIDAKSIVIKDEFLYYIGDSNFEFNEEKIPANVKVVDLSFENKNNDFINFLENSKKTIESDLKKFEEKKNFKFNFSDFSKFIRDRDFKGAINFVNENRTGLYSENFLKDKIFRNSIIDETLQNSSITSKNTGYISKNIDGLEELYNFKVLDLIDETDFNFTSNIENTQIAGIKVVNNLKYYLCILVDKDSFKEEKTLEISINGKNATGFIRNIKSGENKDLLFVEFSTLFEEIKDKRFLDLKIVKNFRNSYELPKTSISTDDRGNNYIYTLDSFGNLKKIKVNVLYKNVSEEFVYIDSKDLYLNPFANIVKNSSNLKGISDEK